jgi:thiol-disulfide isomerase/thioredoxin
MTPLFSRVLPTALALLVVSGCAAKSDSRYTPEPVSLDELVTEIGSREGDVVVVNFWATWCAPCRIEFPELVQFGKDFEPKGVDLVFVSTDFESDVGAATDFLQEQGVPWDTFIKTGVDQNFIDAFHTQWSGALPATFVYDRDGHLRAFWEGITSYSELEKTVNSML